MTNAFSQFEILAYTGGKLRVDGFDLPVVVDLAGLEAEGEIPIVIKHDTSDAMVLGQTDPDRIINDGQQLILGGQITAEPSLSPSVARVMAMAEKGHRWQASIGAQVEASRDIAPNEVITVNGQQLEGPFTLATRAVLRETSVLGMGADRNTKVVLSAEAILNMKAEAMDQPMNEPATESEPAAELQDFETWIKETLKQDPGSLSELTRSALAKTYAAEHRDKADAVDAAYAEPDGDEVDAAAPAVGELDGDEAPNQKGKDMAAESNKLDITAGAQGGDGASLDDSILKQRAAVAKEARRVAEIRAKCGGNEMLFAKAVEQGWSPDKAELEFLKASKPKAPYGHVSNDTPTDTIQAIQAGLLIRAGGKIDHPDFGGTMGLALDLPTWLRAGVNESNRAKVMEAGWKYRDISLPELCKLTASMNGLSHDGTASGKSGFIRAAVSGGQLADIFTTNINALLIQKLVEMGDSTAGWTRESDANNFQTMERTRLVKGPRLTKHARGGEADHATRSDVMQSYKISRYSQQFKIDEMDIIDDRFNALQDIPNEMGLAVGRLRPDLVYSIILANPTINKDSVGGTTNLFSASQPGTQSNLVASGGTLSATTLSNAMAALFNFTENSVNVGAWPTHALVPMSLASLMYNLLQGQNVALAGTAGSVTERGSLSGLYELQRKYGQIEVVIDPRLSNGVTDPDSGTAYSGSTTTWRLVSNKVPTIEVAYLKGSGRAPQVRQYILDQGRWGIGWDVNMDIGAKALDWRGFYEARA